MTGNYGAFGRVRCTRCGAVHGFVGAARQVFCLCGAVVKPAPLWVRRAQERSLPAKEQAR